MTSSSNNPNQAFALAGGSTAAADVSKILASQSPSGAKFFIRADGQYFVAKKFDYYEGWKVGGKIVMETLTRKILTAALGFKPNGEGEIFLMGEFFFN